MAKQKKRPKTTRLERLCRALLIALMSVSALWGVWQLLVPKPAHAEDDPPGVTAPHRGGANAPQNGSEPDDGADNPYKRKDNCWTFLLIGMDTSGGNTDSLMLATYDVDAQSVSVASIARDTRVDVERKNKKINAAYALAGGVEALKEEVTKTFGVPVDYYFRVNIRGFVRLVNAVDGVDFEVPCYMDYDDPEQTLSIHYSKGMKHLNGQQALEVCRFRQNNEGSPYGPGYGDEGRQTTQRGVLMAVLKKALAHPEKLNEYLNIASENLETDIKLSELAWFATKAVGFDTENLHAMSMPCEWINPYMYLKPEETLAMVNEYLNPYTTPRTEEMLDIITRNK